ncbi:AraC family transcriptional regulator [Aestuariibacter sp. A3R04]|uniref:AraC family transcriptional regulator n=1 Tax=Aestuariibacter sp. A3R04 TaxID=2841571 RepID=UPI001C08B7CA|nr:AraC family transcriptional regulator [Aestuariibacter sp. A3R04]MBU3023631.1 AraC family transcriptional regulator [Aestuariibacter sp. A3R04]
MNFDYKNRVNTPISDEPIGRLLDSLRMESAFFTQSILTAPWAMEMPPMHNCMMFHLVLEGEATFHNGPEKVTLHGGDFMLYPKGEGHRLSDGSCSFFTPLHDLPIKTVTERYETLEYGGSGTPTSMVCGVLLFQHPLAIKLLGILPSSILIRRNNSTPDSIVENIADLLKSETNQIGIGAEAVIARLADIMVITAMRRYLQELGDDKTGWLGALEDDRIGKALKLIHDAPAHHWSLDELAQRIGMSRTSFANQFKKLVGNTPIEYLTEWRMSLAYSRLQLSKDSILMIGLDIGYQSEAAFSRAFKKVMGKSPTEVRKAYQMAM